MVQIQNFRTRRRPGLLCRLLHRASGCAGLHRRQPDSRQRGGAEPGVPGNGKHRGPYRGRCHPGYRAIHVPEWLGSPGDRAEHCLLWIRRHRAFPPTAKRTERDLGSDAQTGKETARLPVRSARIVPGHLGNQRRCCWPNCWSRPPLPRSAESCPLRLRRKVSRSGGPLPSSYLGHSSRWPSRWSTAFYPTPRSPGATFGWGRASAPCCSFSAIT